MIFQTKYPSPVGMLTLSGDGEALTGLWLQGQKYYAASLPDDAPVQDDLPIFAQAKAWLDAYFGGEALPPLPTLAPEGSAFQKDVWALLQEIPYGSTTTYGALAAELNLRGHATSARAVGGAVGHNPISIIIPCHRVLGADGSLTGYAGGIEAKRFLLELEAE